MDLDCSGILLSCPSPTTSYTDEPLFTFARLLAETPLTVASQLDKPRNMLIALVSGGYHIDYRTRGGLTALHRAAQKNNYEAVKVRAPPTVSNRNTSQ